MNTRAKALQAIQKQQILLVFPIKAAKEPTSIWSALYPRTKMRWEWDESGDRKVFDLWRLREELSRSGKVVYAKWYQGRATFFSREMFTHLLAYLRTDQGLSGEAARILEILEMDSPLSTKQIKEFAELQGRWMEATYNRAMKELWERLWIAGFGEIEDSSFPSLAVGASQNLFEDLWLASREISFTEAEKYLNKHLVAGNKFLLYARKIRAKLDLQPTEARLK